MPKSEYKAELFKNHYTTWRFYVERQTVTAKTLEKLQEYIIMYKNCGYTLGKVYNPRGKCIYYN